MCLAIVDKVPISWTRRRRALQVSHRIPKKSDNPSSLYHTEIGLPERNAVRWGGRRHIGCCCSPQLTGRIERRKRKKKEGLRTCSLFTENLRLSLPRIYRATVFTAQPGICDHLRIGRSRTAGQSWALKSGVAREQAHHRNLDYDLATQDKVVAESDQWIGIMGRV